MCNIGQGHWLMIVCGQKVSRGQLLDFTYAAITGAYRTRPLSLNYKAKNYDGQLRMDGIWNHEYFGSLAK